VIAEVTEVSEPPVDNRMAELVGVVFRWTTDRIKIGDSKRRSADLDEIGVKIDDAMASRKAKVQARKHERERWIHLLEQEPQRAEERDVSRIPPSYQRQPQSLRLNMARNSRVAKRYAI